MLDPPARRLAGRRIGLEGLFIEIKRGRVALVANGMGGHLDARGQGLVHRGAQDSRTGDDGPFQTRRVRIVVKQDRAARTEGAIRPSGVARGPLLNSGPASAPSTRL